MNNVEIIIKEITQEAQKHGVEIDLTPNGDQEIWISMINRREALSGKARIILEELIAEAKDSDIIVRGAIAPKNQKLEEYYKEIGFDIQDDGDRSIIIS